MSQWYLHDNASNRRIGPMDADAARAEAARNPSLLAWKEGMGDWLEPVKTEKRPAQDKSEKRPAAKAEKRPASGKGVETRVSPDAG